MPRERSEIVQVLVVEICHRQTHCLLDDAEVHGHVGSADCAAMHAHRELHAPIVAVHALARRDTGKGVRC